MLSSILQKKGVINVAKHLCECRHDVRRGDLTRRTVTNLYNYVTNGEKVMRISRLINPVEVFNMAFLLVCQIVRAHVFLQCLHVVHSNSSIVLITLKQKVC